MKQGREEGVEQGIQQGKGEAEAAAAAATQAAAEARKYENIVRSVPAEDLRAYWRLDDAGLDAVDVHTTVPTDRHNGAYVDPAAVVRTVAGALSTGQDPADRSAAFNGTSGYVEVGYHLLLNPPVDLTVEAWVRPEAGIASPSVVVGSFEEVSGSLVNGYSLEVVMQPSPRVIGRLGNPQGEAKVEAGLGDGQEHDGWRHVVLTYTQKEKCLRLYVNADNALPDASEGSPQDPRFYVSTQRQRLRIGAGPAADATLVRPFHGRIDEVAVYGMPLAGDRVQAHFKAATSISS